MGSRPNDRLPRAAGGTGQPAPSARATHRAGTRARESGTTGTDHDQSNSITDTGIIQELYRASGAGVQIDLIVRGICCLRPGIPGVSDRITVRSIVGRFLEHSRIYLFENGGAPRAFIGSADLMERNLDRRVEVLCPVLERGLLEYLRETVLGAYLRDSDRAAVLGPDGSYTSAAPGLAERFSAQDFLLRRHTTDYA